MIHFFAWRKLTTVVFPRVFLLSSNFSISWFRNRVFQNILRGLRSTAMLMVFAQVRDIWNVMVCQRSICFFVFKKNVWCSSAREAYQSVTDKNNFNQVQIVLWKIESQERFEAEYNDGSFGNSHVVHRAAPIMDNDAIRNSEDPRTAWLISEDKAYSDWRLSFKCCCSRVKLSERSALHRLWWIYKISGKLEEPRQSHNQLGTQRMLQIAGSILSRTVLTGKPSDAGSGERSYRVGNRSGLGKLNKSRSGSCDTQMYKINENERKPIMMMYWRAQNAKTHENHC